MEPMGWGDYFIVLGCCAITMLVCRVVPLFVLKGKELPDCLLYTSPSPRD